MSEEEEARVLPKGEASQSAAEGDLASLYQLDVAKLHALASEQQNLYLLTFATDLERHIDALDSDGVSNEQANLKKELLQIITLASPVPTRVLREILGRCFAGIFGKGNRKLLYETIHELVAVVNATKDKDTGAKCAAVSCLGALFEAAGDSAVSLSPLACAAILKTVRPAANETGFRGATFKALGRIVRGIKIALDEDVSRSIWKQARSAITSDRSLLVQANACLCLEQLVRCTPYFDNSNDFEKLQAALYKAIESHSTAVRHTAASCLATELTKSFSESLNNDVVPSIRKPRKVKKAAKGEDLDEELERASSPAPEKPATALSYTLTEMLRTLSTHYCKSSTTNRARAGLVVCYVKIFKTLGGSVVERKYSDIALHLFHDILNHPSMQFHRYRQLLGRKFVRIILEQVVGRMLGETAQLNSCRFLLNDIIKNYPQAVKEISEPSKRTLTAAVSAVTALIKDLDAAIYSIADLCRESLLQVLQHPNFTVQIHAARALRAFVLASPQQLLLTVTITMNSVNRELSLLSGPRQAPKRCVGYAYGLAAVLSTSSQHPLYGSVEVYARVLEQATTILKNSGSLDLRLSACQLQVAWVMIGGLMSLGPNFVKIHLSQLMLLWKNALRKPLGNEHIAQRNMIELSYLAHVRECALGSIKAFITFNQRLLTADVSRRLSAMLESTMIFLQSLPEKKTSDDPSNRLLPALQLQDYELMVRRRVFQCFCQLITSGPAGSLESTAHSTILPLAVATFADQDYQPPSALSAAIAGAAAAFERIWDVADNYGFGVTGLVQGLNIRHPITRSMSRHWSGRSGDEDIVAEALETPVGASPEYDPTCCYLDLQSGADYLPNPPATEAVNAAIAAFGLCLPLQDSKVQESILEQIASFIDASTLQKDPARKVAVCVNVSLALMSACQVATGDVGDVKGNLQHQGTEKALKDLLHECLKDNEDVVRLMAAEAIGRTCSCSDPTSTSAEVGYLTDTIVKNREPHVRAGCAVALASIHAQLGGMAAGFHMKNIVGILMSLASDTHPLVHFWALDSLAQVAESAGLNFSGYVNSSMGVLSQLYFSDSHHSETSALNSSNMSFVLPIPAAVARGIDAIVNVLGPDLQDMTKARDMIMMLERLFAQEGEVSILLENMKCMEHLSLYAPNHLDYALYVQHLQSNLDSDFAEISTASLEGLATLMRRDAPEILRTAKPGLEDALWDVLNKDGHQALIRNIFLNWLHQTGLTSSTEWISRFSTILTKTQAKVDQRNTAQVKAMTAPDLQDEEVAGFAVASDAQKEDGTQTLNFTQELMSSQVRLFALECMEYLIVTISKDATVADDSPGEAALQQKVADVVRIAFSASTAGVAALRVVGMRIIDQILRLFGRTPDPDFPEAMLLEQYQAQISSALTPAFAADSSPELAAAAVSVCATFIATGIVTDVERMGRILKVLVSGLESFSADTDSASIGDLKGLSANAQVMVRMAVFTAWAQLQIASVEQKYLAEVVQPHVAYLVPLWLSSLREYARLRFEPDISASIGALSLSGDLDTTYAALNRQTLLGFYQKSWLSLVEAIASLIDENSALVFDAMDRKHSASETTASEAVNGINGTNETNNDISYRDEPLTFFFVLFGLAFEALAVRSGDDELLTKQRNLDILRALKKILRPTVAGSAVYQEVVFSETMDLLDRMILTESLGVQSMIVEIARNLCIAHPSSRKGLQIPIIGESLSEDIEQLFELTRIIVLVLAGLIPGLSDTPVSVHLETSDEANSLVRSSLQALVDVSDVFPSIIKTDLHATILHVYVTILGTGICQAIVVPQALPIFKRFVTSIVTEGRADTAAQLQRAVSRMLMILKHAQKRETQASLPCEKNTLLAITIILSSAQEKLTDEDPLIVRFLAELCGCLEGPKTSRVAAGCMRTLLMAGTSPRLLITQSVKFLVDTADLEGLDESRSIVAQTLTMYVSTVSSLDRPRLTAVTMAAVLEWVTNAGAKAHPEAAARLLDLAAVDNANFRVLVAGMGRERKRLLEEVLRSRTGLNRAHSDTGLGNEPTITLKMNFGEL